jgi:hypothetical protein
MVDRRQLLQAVAMAASLALVLAGLWFLLVETRGPAPAQGLPTHPITAGLVVSTPWWTIRYGSTALVPGNATAFGILVEASHRLGFPVNYSYWRGLEAYKVDAINNTWDGREGRYWQYWVDGEYQGISADKRILGDGDRVEWRFEGYVP